MSNHEWLQNWSGTFYFLFFELKAEKHEYFRLSTIILFLNYFICLKAWSFSGFWSIYLYIFQDNVFVTIVTSIQYWALSDKAADAFYKLSNTKAQIQSYVFVVWMCNWTLKLKVTMLVLIMKLKETCPLLLNKVSWVRIC